MTYSPPLNAQRLRPQTLSPLPNWRVNTLTRAIKTYSMPSASRWSYQSDGNQSQRIATNENNAPLKPDPLLPEYRWNPAARHGHGAYIDARGRFVSNAVIRDQLDKVLDGITAETRQLGERLLDGTVTVDEWYRQMTGYIKSTHLIGAAMERGGWANMTYADFGRVGRIVRDERAYLDNFKAQLEAGLFMDGRALVRMQLYIQAGRGTFYEFADQTAALNQFTMERRILDPAARHCACCVDEANKGPQPLGTLAPIGGCSCGSNCRCSKVYINGRGEEIYA